MSDNLREFQLGIRDFVDVDVPELVRERRDALALEALNTIVYLTPYDTGRARGNYQISEGAPPEGYDPDLFDPSGAGTIERGARRIEAFDAFKSNEWATVWIHNGVPYILYLNDGTPKMAAFHMLEQTVDHLASVMSE